MSTKQIKGVAALLSEIQLSENGQPTKEVQILKVGKFKDSRYGNFDITSKMLSDFKKNFDNKVRGIDIAFDYNHKSDDDASGWPQSLRLSDDGNKLLAVVDWTPKAQQKIADKELRYFSPDYASRYTDENGTVHDNVLLGGGLTNRPVLKNMQPISLNERDNMKTAAELQAELDALQTRYDAQTVKLSEATKANPAELQEQVTALTKQVGVLKIENADLKKAQVSAEEAKVLSEKTVKFDAMLAKGTVVEAQRKPYLEGNFDEYVKLSEVAKPNFKAQGSGSSDPKLLSEGAEQEIQTLVDAKMKEDPKKSYSIALSEANREISTKAK